MTTTNDLVLRCSGTTCGGVVVPAFELSQGSSYGISVPTGFGEDWTSLMKTLSGEIKNPNVQLFQSGVTVCPQLGCKQFGDDANVGDSLKSLGFSATDYDAINAKGRVVASTTIDELPATPKLLINLLGALRTPNRLIVFTTAGLDPLGIKAANRLIAMSEVTGLHLFATSLSSFYRQSAMFDEVVECTDAK
jgi:hypothetical protein